MRKKCALVGSSKCRLCLRDIRGFHISFPLNPENRCARATCSSNGLPALPSLTRDRKCFAPAVLSDFSVDHLAGCRCLEQRAHSATVNAVWGVLIFSLLPRHFFRCGGLRNAQHKLCRG